MKRLMAQRYVHEYIREIDPKEEKCHLVIELDPKLTLAEAIDHVIESGVQGMPLLTWEGQTMGCLDVRRLVADYLMRMKKRDLVITKALDAIQEGVCICDEQGVVRVWNLAIQKIYEISDEEIVGKNLTEFFPDAIDSQVLKTEEKISYKKHQPKPGADILISAAPIYSEGKLIGVVSTDRRLQDAISLSKRLNEAIRFIEVLEKKIEQDSIHTTDFFVGTNERVLEQVDIAIRAAKTDVPILITGETGTGKEVFSRFVHKKSGLKGNFVPVNCSAIPENLFESEFFGYEKGAFTGADTQGRAGYFEQADGGTLFLDEVSELPLVQQTKLLRTIQEGKVRRLGSNKEIPVAVRLISASNAELERLVKEKEFRIDLYYRLKGIMIELPALREREEDMETIISHFLEQIRTTYNEQVDRIPYDALDVLKRYDWPGNVRELQNVLRQMVVMAIGNELTTAEIPDDIRCAVLGECEILPDALSDENLDERMARYEKEIIEFELKNSGNNIAKTAEKLGIPRTTLQYRIKKLQI